MKTEGTLIYHKITVATGLLQNNPYGNELVLFCLIIPCAHCLFMLYFYKKCKWLFWFCVHRHRSMRSIAQSIDRTGSMYTHWMQSQILSSFLQGHLAMKTSIFLLLVFVLLFLYRVEVATLILRPSRLIDRSINRSVVIRLHTRWLQSQI